MRHRVVGLDLVQLLARDGPEDLVEALLRRGRLAHFTIVNLDLHEDRDVVARRLELVDGVQVERDLAPADFVFQLFEREERARVERRLDVAHGLGPGADDRRAQGVAHERADGLPAGACVEIKFTARSS